MTINNLTIQAQEALQSAMSLATGHGQQAVEPLHILEAIVTEDDSVGVYLLQKLGVNINALRSMLKQEIDRLPKVSGGDPTSRVKAPKLFKKRETLHVSSTTSMLP